MNRIYQGEVTKVEILFPSSEGRGVGKSKDRPAWQPFDPDPKPAKDKWQSVVLSRSNGERSEVRRRTLIPWQTFDPKPKRAKCVAQAIGTVDCAPSRSVIGYRSLGISR